MPTIKAEIKLHQKQREFWESQALYRGFVGGRGSGKSWAGAFDMLTRAQAGRTYLIGSPTGVLLGDTTFPTFKSIAQQLGIWAKPRMAPYPTVTLRTGATIRFRTAEDPERMRGPNLSGIWLDEASLMVREAFDICIACLREGGEQGWLSGTFTPKGFGNWTYDVFGRPRPNTEIFYASTKDNPFNPPEFYDTLKQQYGDAVCEQELEGRFVDHDEGFQVIPSAWIRAAMDRWSADRQAALILDALGVDVARGGIDKTVLAKRYGVYWAKLLKYPGKSTPDGFHTAGLVINALKENQKALVCVDADMVGGSPLDILRKLMPGIRLHPFYGSRAVNQLDRTRTHRFRNARAFAWWSMRELLDPANKSNAMLPPDEELLAELSAPRWEMTLQGIQIEPKDCQKPKAEGGKCCIKHRLGRSPDCADAVCYSILMPPQMARG